MFPRTVAVLPSLHKKLGASDLMIERTNGLTSISFRLLDAYRNEIKTLEPVCSYFKHERIVFTVKTSEFSGNPT
jgi:hypothetical protein